MPITEEESRHFEQAFDDIESRVHQTAVDKGWWDECYTCFNITATDGRVTRSGFDPAIRNTGEAIALMHSELSEALEYARKGNGPSDHIPKFSGVEEEFADVIIRIMDYSKANNLDVSGAIIAKARFNATREHKHGGKDF